MTTKHLGILLAVLLGGLSSVFLLPTQLFFQPVGINLELPEYLGEWWGKDLQVSEREIQTLGAGTQFARKAYVNGRGDEVQVSIVLGGQDMNTSIHRPERCLPAQGWTVTDNGSRAVALQGQPAIEVTRLHNLRNITGPDQKSMPLYNINYYWFVGSNEVTNSHLKRTFMDIRDRVFKGYNQRWAYVTVSSVVTANLQRFGRDERQTDALLEDVVARLVPKLQKH